MPGHARRALRRRSHRGSRQWHTRCRLRIHLWRWRRRQRRARGRCGLLGRLRRWNHRGRNQRRSSRRRTQERGQGAARWRSLGHRQACSGKTPIQPRARPGANLCRRRCGQAAARMPAGVRLRPRWSWRRLRRCPRNARSACLLRKRPPPRPCKPTKTPGRIQDQEATASGISP
ncbi:hypothetical protein XACM_0516 [Xanthomonas euvesicatoria pv. citrumelo F1]|nr:hypothetical protein XACM_0516 [Xanthomonas euvesicatoria pv. citrumelo F1]